MGTRPERVTEGETPRRARRTFRDEIGRNRSFQGASLCVIGLLAFGLVRLGRAEQNAQRHLPARSDVLAPSQPSANALNNEGTAALAAGDYARALALFQRAAKLSPDDLNITFNIGLTYFRMGQYQEAVNPLRRSANDPASAEKSRYLLGISLYQVNDLTVRHGNLSLCGLTHNTPKRCFICSKRVTGAERMQRRRERRSPNLRAAFLTPHCCIK